MKTVRRLGASEHRHLLESGADHADRRGLKRILGLLRTPSVKYVIVPDWTVIGDDKVGQQARQKILDTGVQLLSASEELAASTAVGR